MFSLPINYSILLTTKKIRASPFTRYRFMYMCKRIIESEFVLVTKDLYPSLMSEITNEKKRIRKEVVTDLGGKIGSWYSCIHVSSQMGRRSRILESHPQHQWLLSAVKEISFELVRTEISALATRNCAYTYRGKNDAIPDHPVTLQGTKLACYGRLDWQPISTFH